MDDDICKNCGAMYEVSYGLIDFSKCQQCQPIWHYALSTYPGEYKIVRCHPNNGYGTHYKIEDVDTLLAAKDQRIEELEARVQQLEAESPSDDFLNDLIWYFGGVGKPKYVLENYTSKAMTEPLIKLLDLRRKNKEASDEV